MSTHPKYVHELFDAMIAFRRGPEKARYADVHIFREVYKSKKRISKEWLHFCHNVSECPRSVIAHCKRVLKKAGIKLPKNPDPVRKPRKKSAAAQVYLEAAE